jgi:hypothetical protein
VNVSILLDGRRMEFPNSLVGLRLQLYLGRMLMTIGLVFSVCLTSPHFVSRRGSTRFGPHGRSARLRKKTSILR